MSVIKDVYDFLKGSDGDDGTRSHRILKTVMYEAQVNVLTGRMNDVKKTLVDRLEEFDRSMMVIADFCVEWVTYVHVAAFSVLPSFMFDSISDNPSKIAGKVESLILIILFNYL